MLRLRVTGYNYNSFGAWELVLGGYNYSVSGAWFNATAATVGSAPVTAVKFGHDGTRCCIVLVASGGFAYPKIVVDDFVVGYTEADADWGSGWGVDIIASEAGITYTQTPTINAGLNADLLDGQHGAFYQNAGNLNAGTLPDARISDTGNQTPTLVNSFSFGGIPLRYRRVGGICYISGQVSRAAVPLGLTIFTLPTGYRPSAGQQSLGEMFGAGNNQRQPFRFSIDTAGVVQATWAAGEATGGTAPTGTLTFTLNFSFPVA